MEVISIDQRELRYCFGKFATGVTVVSWHTDEGERRGITVNSFTSESHDPPLVLVSIDRKAKACQTLKNRSFVINILSEQQEDIAWQFAGRPQQDFNLQWEDNEIGPIIKGALAHIECLPWAEYDGGDHVLYLGEVKDFYYQDCGLIFYQGKFLTTKLLIK
jgi:flavin reductase (DIM6/NTAB) family NADH-FMN oxidoreductase RutF